MPLAATIALIIAAGLVGVGIGLYLGYREARDAADRRLAEAALRVAGTISEHGRRYMLAFVSPVAPPPLDPVPILREIARLAAKHTEEWTARALEREDRNGGAA